MNNKKYLFRRITIMKISIELTTKDLEKIRNITTKLSKTAGEDLDLSEFKELANNNDISDKGSYTVTEREDGTKVYTYLFKEKFASDLLAITEFFSKQIILLGKKLYAFMEKWM